ncbi:MAG: hypothetical protein ACREF4_00445 [Gammaproteobacteria bacterium]
MLVALVTAAAGLLSSLTLAVAPAVATESALADPRETTAVIRRIQSAPSVAVPEREARARTPAGRAKESIESRLDQRAQELANLRLQVAALQRSLAILQASVERAFQRLEPAVQPQRPAPARPAPAKSPTAAPRPTPPTPKTSSPATVPVIP